MNAPVATNPKRPLTPLKAWRKRQMVRDADKCCTRTMRITDAEPMYGIPAGTWHAWEQEPDHPAFRIPDKANMAKLAEIIGPEFSPEWFYPVDEWRRRFPAAAGETLSGG